MRTFISGLYQIHAHARAFLLALVGLFLVCGAPLRADQTTQLVPGSTITLSVTANGTPPFSYQWRKNGANIAGANSASLVLSNVSASDAGNYSVVVSNSAGSTTSDLAIVTAPSVPVIAPAIITQPAGQTVIPDGEDGVLLSVTASGSVPLSYQWKKNGANIPGATDSSFSIDPVTAGDFGAYTVMVSNSAGSVESNPAQITDGTIPPTFTSQLIGQTVTSGSTVTFSLVASGTAPISYQWRINGTNLANSAVVSGANTATLRLTGVTPAYSALYSVIATNSAGSTSSNSATLLVNDPPPVVPPTPPTPENPNPPPVSQDVAPAFTTQPVSKIAAIGEVVSFSASVTARPNATYRWQKDGVDLFSVGTVSGADTPVLTLFGVRTSDAGVYRLVATNSVAATTSSPATLQVKSIQVPTIITQPVAQQANLGSVAFFTVAVSAFPAPTYQWRKNGVNLSNGGNITGANRPTLAVSNLASSDAGNYSVVITNEAGSATSNNAALTTDGTPVVTGQPMITSQPPTTTVASTGSVVQLAVTVAGDPVPTVQWRKNGVPLTNGGIVSGATSTILTLTGVTSADAAAYSVVATNSLGSVTSDSFHLTVQGSNVWNQPVTAGKDVALSAPDATGNIQWQISTNSGASWTNLAADSTYSGVTTNTLHIANVSTALNTALYRLVTVSNGETTVLHSARLNVASAFVPFPVSVSADSSGNLYVADASNDTIEKINVSSRIATLAGTAGQTGTADGSGTAARFNEPSGIAAAADGTLAVADKANATIRVITPAGVVSTLAGSTTLRGNVDGTGSAATFSSPNSITRDSAGNFYVADSMNHTIRKVTPGGVVTTLAGAAGQAGNSDGTGNAARFNNPAGIEVDPAGNLFVADTGNNLIRKVTPTGVVTTVAGLGGVTGTTDGAGNLALFNQPSGVAVDNSGNVYVADTGNSTIRRVSSAGVVITVAGLPGIAGHKDGSGINAWFNQPRDVAVSSNGFLYVADTGNASIRRIDQTGVVTTVPITTQPATDPNPTNPLPPPPTLPTTPTLPTLPTSPTPPSTGGGGGGGGGAPSLWFLGALATLALLRRSRTGRRV